MRYAVFCLAALMLYTLPTAAETVQVGKFSAGDLAGWEDKSFKGQTQ